MQTVDHDESYWRQNLSAEQYRVLREKGTEAPFTGKLLENKETGMYACAACGLELFRSAEKYDSGSGWPSFWTAAAGDHVKLHADDSHGMRRTEVTCARCGSHLGHVFEDGPQPTGQRFCINSVSLVFQPGAKNEQQ